MVSTLLAMRSSQNLSESNYFDQIVPECSDFDCKNQLVSSSYS